MKSVHGDSHGEHLVLEVQEQIRLLTQEEITVKLRKRDGTKLLRAWKNHLLADSDHTKTTDAFLAHCILPRCILTPEDATFCAAFVRKLVLEDTPFFSFLYLMQQVCATTAFGPADTKPSLKVLSASSVMCCGAKRRVVGHFRYLMSASCHGVHL